VTSVLGRSVYYARRRVVIDVLYSLTVACHANRCAAINHRDEENTNTHTHTSILSVKSVGDNERDRDFHKLRVEREMLVCCNDLINLICHRVAIKT